MSSVLRQVESLGGVHAFIVVIRAGQSRYCTDVTLAYKDGQARLRYCTEVTLAYKDGQARAGEDEDTHN